MKKNYNKPQLIYESFELSQSIASDCTYISNASKGVCGIVIDDGSFFGREITIYTKGVITTCTTTPTPGKYDDLCYDVPEDNKNVFSS